MSNILLETGNGEFEIVEFLINGARYGINVLKIKEIIRINEVSPIPGSPNDIVGRAVVRNNMVSTIDLKKVLNKKSTDITDGALGLLCELNQTTVVFLIEEVAGIRRVKWSELDNTHALDNDSLVVGSVLLDEKIIMLLDFESILLSLNPKNNFYNEKYRDMCDNSEEKKHIRSKMDLILADDSRVVRELLKNALEDAGYTNLRFFNDGAQVYQYLVDVKENYGDNFKQQVNLLISDIEMPILDGYSLTKKIKDDKILNTLPVILFSSLITEDLQRKGESVGADAQISKPDIKQLISIVDNLIGIR
ncbi:chemotaxis protein [Niameybacter massiliensis]|uniref:chemotaxis protein n=1 Tax=Niameybacter massiliensis TaxID=1658108 RepID=UPI0006B54B1A|nr:chemotaxis protein [Niameybacter massiliensis]